MENSSTDIRNQLASQFKRATKEVKSRQTTAAKSKALKSLFRELAPVCGIPLSDVTELWDFDAPDAAHQLREIYSETLLAHVYVLTGIQTLDIFTDSLAAKVWKEFLRHLDADCQTILAFKVKFMGTWVITLQEPTDTCPGRLRAIIPSAGEDDAYLMPLGPFIKEYGRG